MIIPMEYDQLKQDQVDRQLRNKDYFWKACAYP